MVSRLLSLALAWFMLGSALQAPGLTMPASLPHSGQSELQAAGAAPQAVLAGAGGAHSPGDQPAQWHAEGAGEPHELLRMHPGEPSTLLASGGHGPFVGPVPSAPYLDGPQRPPCAAGLAA